MKVRVLAILLSFAALQWVGMLHSQNQPVTPPKPLNPEEIRRNALEAQQELTRQFTDFQSQLQKLKSRLERGQSVEDQDRAAQLEKVLEEADSSGIRSKFAKLNEHLAKEKFTIDDFQEAAKQTEDLAKDLSRLVDLVNSQNNRLSEQILEYKKAIERLETIIKKEQQAQAVTEQNRTDKVQTAELQRDVTQDTRELRNALDPKSKKEGNDKKPSPGSEAKSEPKDNKGKQASEARESSEKKPAEAREEGASDPKANPKDADKQKGEAKGGEKKPAGPESKDGEKKDNKGSENKDAGAKGGKDNKDSKEAKGAPKDAKTGENKPGESKDAAGKKDGAEAKGKEAGEAKEKNKQDPKGGDAKAKTGDKGENKAGAKDAKGAKDSKDGAPKGAPKDAKSGESKPGESKDAAGKKDGAEAKGKEAGEAKEKKNADNKLPDPTAKENGKDKNDSGAKAKDNKDGKKNTEAKGSEAKDSPKDGKQAEAKEGGEPKAGQKSEAKPGQPKEGGDPKDGGEPPQAKGDNQPSPPKEANEKDPPIGKKQIQDAIYKMEQAEKKIKEGKNPDAGVDQEEAIGKLKDAKKELEKRLQQLREEELERLLANLKARCERMKAMQLAVLEGVPDGTKATWNAIQASSDKKATDVHISASIKLSLTEKEIIVEATKAIEILEGEGSAVAFPVAFQQVREDMRNVQRRLEITEVGPFTQRIEQDIIDSLSDMIKALDKKKADMDKEKEDKKKKKNKDGDAKDKQQGPPPDQKLLDQIAELKMIRSMQMRVNDRTKAYADENLKGQEQLPGTAAPLIRREINELRDRQERIYDITNKIQKGDNK